MSQLRSQIRVFSYGGGVQSNAVLALQITGKLEYNFDAFVFANVGDDSENPETLRYIETVALPAMKRAGIEFINTRKGAWGGISETLLQYIYRTERSIPIPARMSNGAPGRRACTANFKIEVVDKWIRNQGVSEATIGLGISLDEYHRMRVMQRQDGLKTKKFGFLKSLTYPLIDMRLTRDDCTRLCRDVIGVVPPKSSCWFCPFRARSEWIELKRERPDLFASAVRLEEHINDKRSTLERDRVYIHPDLIPLRDVVPDQLPLWSKDEIEECGSGYCFT